jgi:structural maintenance of chromosomes protein 5
LKSSDVGLLTYAVNKIISLSRKPKPLSSMRYATLHRYARRFHKLTRMQTAVTGLHKLQEEVIKIEIRHIEALSDFETMKERHEDVRNILETKKNEVAQVIEEFKTISSQMKKLQGEAQQVAVAASTQPDLEELLQSITDYTMDRLEAEIDSERARLALTHGGNANVIKEFEDRERQIQRLKDKLSTFQESMADVDHAIKEIRDNWEPRLDALVQRISDAFSDSFARIGCAGQVAVDKLEDPPGPNGELGGSEFDQWSIQIQVKFREHEQLSILDSHRQSGGERAVSTIFYLMALQSLSASPFRVVDEINQGMDPRNERMVHERMVDIACAPKNAANTQEDNIGGSGGSQYFLITPKLLSGLVYKPGMRVLCIVSGEHVPDDYHELDFRSAILRKKAIPGPKLSVPQARRRRQSQVRAADVQS